MSRISDWLSLARRAGRGNAWVHQGMCSVYMRYGQRIINGVRCRTIEVANVADLPEAEKGRGHFRDFMVELESLVEGETLYVENVTTERLEAILRRHGFQRVPEHEVDLCFFKTVPMP